MNKILRNAIISVSTTIIGLAVSSVPALASNQNRLAGTNRYKTAIEIAKSGWEKSENVILVTGNNFPDALCAGPLAKNMDAPILLTSKDKLDYETLREIKQLNASNVYIIGGTGVISKNVENELIQNGFSIKRIAGSDRYDTSIKVAKELGENESVVVATGENFPDALSIAPIASQKHFPIILVPKNNINSSIKDYISQKNINKSYIIGGNGVILDKVANQFPNKIRISGKNRYSTNVEIMKHFSNDINFNTLYIATGANFPDALTGTALASKNQSSIILTNNNIPVELESFIENKKDNINNFILLGGETVVPSSTINNINIIKNSANYARRLGDLRKEFIEDEFDVKVVPFDNYAIKLGKKSHQLLNELKYPFEDYEINEFLNKYGKNIFIASVGTGDSKDLDDKLAKPNVVINGTLAYKVLLQDIETIYGGGNGYQWFIVDINGRKYDESEVRNSNAYYINTHSELDNQKINSYCHYSY